MMLKMVCCLVLVGVAAAAPQDHSIQKRQTTVTYADSWTEILGASVNAVVSLGLVTVAWLVIAPLFGVELSSRKSSADLYDTYYDNTYPYDGAYDGYYGYEGRSLQDSSVLSVGRMLLNSIDVVEAAMTYSAIEEEACRFKAVCRAEYAAAKNPIARLAINTINSNLNGLSKYGAAVAAGLNGEDCDLLYSACPEAVGFF